MKKTMRLEEAPELLGTDDLMQVLGCNRDSAMRYCRLGFLPAMKIGRKWYVPKAKLQQFIESGAR